MRFQLLDWQIRLDRPYRERVALLVSCDFAWKTHRAEYPTFYHRRDISGLAVVCHRRHRGDRGQRRTRMAARALTRAARNHRSVGIVAPPRTATAMMLMAAAYGADIRLVAFMQYLIPMAVRR